MEAKTQKLITDYFSYFEEFHNSAKTRLKECQNCAVTINKLIVRCKKINVADTTGTPLEEFGGLQSNLKASITNLISEEISEIQSNLSKVEDSFETLCNKHRVFTKACLEVDFNQETPLVKGTPYQPPLRQLLAFAKDTLTFGSEIVAQIETSLSVLTQKGLETDSLTDNFRILNSWHQRIPEILSYTSFCSENQV